MACRDLGLSLDDIQKCMERKIKQIKKDEGVDAGGTSGNGAARIVEVNVGGACARCADGGIGMGGKRSAERHASGMRHRGFRVVPDVGMDAAAAADAHAARRVAGANTTIAGERASNAGVVLFSAVLFAVCFCAVLAVAQLAAGGIGVVAVTVALVAALLAVSSVHIAQQWEKVVVLRLGKFNRVSGPGLFWTMPVIEQNTMRVDCRVRVTSFGAEETLTADLVPLDVNAVLFWHVWNAKAACTEVGDFTRAVELAAQTALRDAIGRAGAAEVAIRREQLDRELKRVLEEKVAQWGVTILSVEVRDILLPKELQEVMSLEAQASSARRRASSSWRPSRTFAR